MSGKMSMDDSSDESNKKLEDGDVEPRLPTPTGSWFSYEVELLYPNNELSLGSVSLQSGLKPVHSETKSSLKANNARWLCERTGEVDAAGESIFIVESAERGECFRIPGHAEAIEVGCILEGGYGHVYHEWDELSQDWDIWDNDGYRIVTFKDEKLVRRIVGLADELHKERSDDASRHKED